MRHISKNKLFKILSLNSVSVAVGFVLGVASTYIISTFLGARGMALMGNFKNFTAMARSLATLGINNTIITLLVAHRNDRVAIGSIYSTLFWLFLGLSGFLCVVIFAMSDALSLFLFNTPDFALPIRALGLLLPLIVLNVFWMAVYNALEMFKRIIVIQILSNVAVFVLTAAAIYTRDLMGGLYAIAFAELVMTLVTFWFVRRDRQHFKFELSRLINWKYARVVGSFSAMALVSGILVPLAAILVRNDIMDEVSMAGAGLWDAVQRISGFYMIFFTTGLSLYYLPKLSSITTDDEFRTEVKSYFRSIVLLAALVLAAVYALRSAVISLALTDEFAPVSHYLHWQIAGDFARIMTLAFGYQIVVKRMMRSYLLVEFGYNLLYVGLAFHWIPIHAEAGALQAYFVANVAVLAFMLVLFRRTLLPRLG